MKELFKKQDKEFNDLFSKERWVGIHKDVTLEQVIILHNESVNRLEAIFNKK